MCIQLIYHYVTPVIPAQNRTVDKVISEQLVSIIIVCIGHFFSAPWLEALSGNPPLRQNAASYLSRKLRVVQT